MKYLVTAAMALALAGAAAMALADTPPDNHHQDEHKSSEHAPAARGGAPKANRDTSALDDKMARVHKEQQGVDDRARDVHKEQQRVDQESARIHNEQAGIDREHAEFRSHALRPNDRGRAYYNPGSFKREYRPSFRFRVGVYNRPAGWYEHSWNYGDRLPFGWFTPAYYLDWGSYRLPMPPIGCEWVREGSDAVLVDIWTGEVLSVYRGVFY